MVALLTGIATGLSLIIAIGAQNAFVIRQGLLKQHVLPVVVICASSDALLILLGTGGLGAIVQERPLLLELIRWFGVAYLLWFGLKSAISAFDDRSLQPASTTVSSLRKAILTCIGFTFLNPHVYLDTVILLGSIANQFDGDRWFFAVGASLASIIWFTAIGFGAQRASKFMSKPIFWKILDLVIAAVMAVIAISLALYDF